MKKNYWEYFEDFKDSAAGAKPTASRDDLQKELDRIEKEYESALGQSGAGADGLPDVPDYERLEYDAPTDEKLAADAESELADYKNSGLESIETATEEARKAKEEKKLAAAAAAEKRAQAVAGAYDDASRTFSDDALKRGLARSSIAANKSASIAEGKAAALSQSAADAETETRSIENEIAALAGQRAKALDSFNIAYAAKLTEKIASLTEARDKRAAEVVKYNNSLLELERKAANERAKLESELSKKSGSKPDAAKALNSRNGAAYEAIRTYLSGLDKAAAAEAVKSDALVRDALTDYYYFQLYNEFGK